MCHNICTYMTGISQIPQTEKHSDTGNTAFYRHDVYVSHGDLKYYCIMCLVCLVSFHHCVDVS